MIRKRDEFKIKKSVTVKFGLALGLDADGEAWASFEGMNYGDAMGLKAALAEGDTGVAEFFRSRLPSYLSEHNFMEDEGQPMTANEVVELLFGSPQAFGLLVKEYTEMLFTSRRETIA